MSEFTWTRLYEAQLSFNHGLKPRLISALLNGTVSESGTGPLDYGATGPVPDPYTLILGVPYPDPEPRL